MQIQVYSYLLNPTRLKMKFKMWDKIQMQEQSKSNLWNTAQVENGDPGLSRCCTFWDVHSFQTLSEEVSTYVSLYVQKTINFVSGKEPRRLFSRPSTSKHLKQFVLAGKLEVDIFLALRCSQTYLVWVWVCVGVGDLIEFLLIPADIKRFWK